MGSPVILVERVLLAVYIPFAQDGVMDFLVCTLMSEQN